MRILFSVTSFNGGAPLSIMQYAKELKKIGHEVCVIGDSANTSTCELYKNEKIQIYNCTSPHKSLERHNYKAAYNSFYKVAQFIKEYKPDLFIASTERYIYYSICKKMGIRCFFMVCGGNLSAEFYEKHLWRAEKTICFSRENYDVLEKAGYDKNRISLISNRIEAEYDKNSENHYKNANGKVKLLLISRIVKTKFGSVKHIVNIADRLSEDKLDVNLKIAGGGELFEELCKLAKDINEKHKKTVIEVLGHRSDIQDLVKEAHIVFGKGRSVIEPVILGRTGIVIGENQEISLCNINSFQNLYEYNFAGRNIEYLMTYDELFKLANEIIKGKSCFGELEETSKLVGKYYSAEFLGEKIQNLIFENDKKIKKSLKVSRAGIIFAILFTEINKIIRRIEIKMGLG